MKKLLLLLCMSLLGVACGGKKAEDKAFEESLRQGPVASSLNQAMIESILQQIPSPIEISVLLKQTGSRYDPKILNPPTGFEKYNTRYKMALNLGVYGTDLGYTNIFEQGKDGIPYIASIKKLADGLSIGQFFDIETIARLAGNSRNLDSLLLITTQNFNAINAYLEQQDRSYQSALLLTGGWIEALYITCLTADKNPADQKLREAIGEQKIILEQINLLLSFYEQDPEMKGLADDVANLNQAYEGVEIDYEHGESTVEVVDGVAVVKTNSKTTIRMPDTAFQAIRQQVQSIRTKIIS